MKAMLNLIKSKLKTLNIVITISALSSISNSFAQNGKVWATIENFPSLGINYENAKLSSTDPQVNQLIQNLKIQSFTQALPSSKSRELQTVYEIECDCDENELISQIGKLENQISNPQIGPKYKVLTEPNDYLTNFSNDYALDLINASQAWDITTGNSDIIIAISDANYYTNHEELVGKINYVTASNTNTNYAHGTAVAITAAGNTNNSLGKSSIGYNSSLQLRTMSYNEILSATYAGAKVINVSWTSGCVPNSYVQDVMNEVFANGTTVVSSAGNGVTCGGATNLVFPAACDHVISVTSVGPYDNHERSVGVPSTAHQHNSAVDLCAPGYDVALSTSPGYYLTGNGSSFAAPFVSGTIALMLAVNPCLTPDNIEYILKETAVNIDAINPDYANQLGAGRLNAHAAVLMASSFSVLNVTATNEFDCLTNEQSLTINSVSGQAPFSYTWNNGSVTQEITNVDAGSNYSVYVTDANGCIGYYETTVNEILPMTFDSQINNVLCNGANNGSVEINVQGGSENYTYSWSNGETSELIDNIGTGIYYLTITDGFGCTITTDFQINEPEPISASILTTPVTILANGTIDLTANGGIAPYTFSWNNGSSDEDLQNLGAGTYTVTVTDANGCTQTNSATINSNTPITPNPMNTNLFTNQTINTMGVEENKEMFVKLYPNPTSDVAYVYWGQMDINTVNLYDLSGKLLSTQTVNDTINQYEIRGLQPGEYFVKLNLKNGEYILKKVTFL